MQQHFQWLQSVPRRVNQDFADQLHEHRLSFEFLEHLKYYIILFYFVPRMAFNLRELELLMRWVHLLNLLDRRRAQDFDDFHQLIGR
jgi:hypothetical protein